MAPGRKNQSGFTGVRDSEWQWHQLDHMQICILTQTHNHASIPPFSFYRPDANQQRQSTERAVDNEGVNLIYNDLLVLDNK